MTDGADVPFQDPLMAPYWAGTAEHRLVIQRCGNCGQMQFYPRPFCLGCASAELDWVQASGYATVHTQTVTRLPVLPDLIPPYIVALVELDEGPRLLTGIVGDDTAIGDRVQVAWRDREDGPPLPVFRRHQA